MLFNRMFLTCVLVVGALFVATPSWAQVAKTITFDPGDDPVPTVASCCDATHTVAPPTPMDTDPVPNQATGNALNITRNPGLVYALAEVKDLTPRETGTQTISARVYSPKAGINWNTKWAPAGGGCSDIESPANEAVVIGWQTLTWTHTETNACTWLVILPDIGTPGAGDVYAVDNIEYTAAEVVEPPASLTAYSQTFEALTLAEPAPGNTALGDDGWLLFTNVFEADGTTFIYNYNSPPDPAPNQSGDGAAFSNVVTGQGGPDQGDNQLTIFNDYNNGDHDGSGRRIESNVFQEQTVGPDDVGKTFRVIFNAKKGDIVAPTTANAFIKTLDPNDGFALTNLLTVDTTNLPETWGTYGIYLPIDASLDGQILQFGFSSTASDYTPSGVVYDNINFGMAPCDGTLTLTGPIAPGDYGAEISATLTDAIADQGDGISVYAPTVNFDGANAGVVVGGVFTAGNSPCGPVDAAIKLAINDVAGNPTLKQANVGAGSLGAGETVTVTFDWKGVGASGGVVDIVLFSEVDGGGVSQTDPIAGGATHPADWTTYGPTAFVVGPDVSGGVTLQFTAICGAVTGCVSEIEVDNVSVVGPGGELAVNGGVDTGDLTGWTTFDNAGSITVVSPRGSVK